MDKSTISNASAILTGALTTAATFGFGVDTTAAVFVGTNASILQQFIARGLESLFGRSLAKSECARLGIAYDEVRETIKRNLKSGKTIRQDGFLDESFNGNYSRANELVEATIKFAIDDSEFLKAQAYGRLLGNSLFCDFDRDSIKSLARTIKELSYRELCTIYSFYGKTPRNFTKLEYDIRHTKQDSTEEAEYFARILHLKTLGVLMPSATFISNSAIGYVFLSKMGRNLCEMMEFNPTETDTLQREVALFEQYALE